MRRLIAVVVFSLLLVASARGVLVVAGPGLENAAGGGACTLWTPSSATVPAVEIFDPSTFTYSGSNFSSGSNPGTGAGTWQVESGSPAKGTQLNGRDVISFTGAQSIINTTTPWPGGNVFVFVVAKVSATQSNSLVSAAYGIGEGRDATHDWVFYPRGGSAFGGSANEAWLFQGTAAGVITRGDLFTDTNYHLAAIKMGTSVDLRLDGTAGSPSSVTGTINTATAAKIRVGATGISGAEALTGSVAYLAVLVDPTTADIQNFEGWAAWRFGLQANLPGGHPSASAPPCAGGPAPGCTVSPCDPAPLTWTQIQADSGIAATRPLTNWGPGGPNYPGSSRSPCTQGIFAYALPGTYSWACGGESYLGDALRWGNNGSYNGVAHPSECSVNKGFECTGMTEFHLVYVEATALNGSAKPTVAGTNVWYRNRSSWCHLAAGGWFLAQHAQTGDPVYTGRFHATQDANQASLLTVTDHGGGVFSEQAPPFAAPPGWANHGWILSRGSYALNSVDGCFTYMEARVDQVGDNHIFACGQDWWRTAGADYPDNTGYSQSSWKRLTVDWTSATCSSLPLAILQADPPPPAVGIGP